jgi:hypothetical protein
MTTANENTENTDRENADRDPEANADPEANPGPTPDFSTLRSAAMTYHMFGATPVPLVNRPIADGKDEEQCGFKTGSPPGRSASHRTDAEIGWEDADGIGVLARKGGWNGLFVEPIEPKMPLFNLRMKGSAWVARNDRSAVIYFRTAASKNILRAVAAIYQEAMPPYFTAAACAALSGGPDGPAVLPVPPSPDLNGGHWEFMEDQPEEPPPLRAFQVSADLIRETPDKEALGKSTSTPNLSIARNLDIQTAQSRRQLRRTSAARG